MRVSVMSLLKMIHKVISLTSLLFVECAGLVIVGALRAADAGDDGREQQQCGGHHRHPDHRDHAGAGPRVRTLVPGLGAAVAVEGGAAAVDGVPRPTPGHASGHARTEEAAVPHPEDVRVARAELRPDQC